MILSQFIFLSHKRYCWKSYLVILVLRIWRPRESNSVRSAQLQRTALDLLLSSATGDPQVDAGSLLHMLSSAGAPHFATSHDDTSQGAVHVFQDEHGHPMTYVFDEKVCK